jgi:HlyD family secretion protein
LSITARQHTRRVLVWIIGTSLLITVGAVVGSLRATSSINAAQPSLGEPDRSILTVPIARRSLEDVVDLIATVAPRDPQSLSTQTQLVPHGEAIVTDVLVKAGSSVRAGDVVMEVAQRPVFLLNGDVPVYRDYLPGDSGKDVAQLQRCLSSLGLLTTPITGTYDTGTSRAVQRLYQGAGYLAPRVGDLEFAQAEMAKNDAAAQASASTASWASAKKSVPGDATAISRLATAKRAAEVQLRAAKNALSLAKRRVGFALPRAEAMLMRRRTAIVTSVVARIGAAAGASALVVGSSGGTVLASADSTAGRLMKIGQSARILDEASGRRWKGRVAAIGVAGADGGMTVRIDVIGSGSSFPQIGTQLRVQVVLTTSGGATLVVPISAITSRTDGTTFVVRVRSGQAEPVNVVAGVTADGFVELKQPEGVATLAPGDQVLVSTRLATNDVSPGDEPSIDVISGS